MRIGVSNLLWTADLDDDVARLLSARGIDTIDVAPTRYFDDLRAATSVEAGAVRRFWQQRGIGITGLQALLHNTCGLSIFGDRETRRRTRAHLSSALRIGAELGARQLVFGAWRNRDRGPLSLDQAIEQAAGFFGDLAIEAERLGVCLGIEPIDARYGNNFLVDHDQAARLVERVGHAGFGLTLDIGCAALAGEDIAALVQAHGPLVGHVQLAEYQLAPLDRDNPVHALAGPLVRAGLPGRVACIEALTPPGRSSLDAIAQSLDVAQALYGG